MSETRDPGNIADSIEVEGNLTVVSVEDADKDGTPEKVEMQDDAGNKIVATFEDNGRHQLHAERRARGNAIRQRGVLDR